MVSVQTEDFDVGSETERLKAISGETGAVVTFVGTVRDVAGESGTLEIEHYSPMTENVISSIAEDAMRRWNLNGIRVIHRVGKLSAREQIVFIGVASKHRGEAFKACEYVIDSLKMNAPFWKKEVLSGGQSWVKE